MSEGLGRGAPRRRRGPGVLSRGVWGAALGCWLGCGIAGASEEPPPEEVASSGPLDVSAPEVAEGLGIPDLARLDRSLDRTEVLLLDARDAVATLGDAQSAFALEGCVRGACPEARAVALLRTAQTAGHRARDAVQSARAELARARRMADAPTVAPLLDGPRRHRLGQLGSRTDDASRTYAIRVAWYERYMAGWAWVHRRILATPAPCGADDRASSDAASAEAR